MIKDDDYLNHLIHLAQDLTRELAEVERRINEHTQHLEGEFIGITRAGRDLRTECSTAVSNGHV